MSLYVGGPSDGHHHGERTMAKMVVFVMIQFIGDLDNDDTVPRDLWRHCEMQEDLGHDHCR